MACLLVTYENQSMNQKVNQVKVSQLIPRARYKLQPSSNQRHYVSSSHRFVTGKCYPQTIYSVHGVIAKVDILNN